MSTLKTHEEFHGRTKFFYDIKILLYSVRYYMNEKTPKACTPPRVNGGSDCFPMIWFYLPIALGLPVFVSFAN